MCWLMVWPCGKDYVCTMPLTSKRAINITLILNLAILVFFGLGDVGLFRWRIWRLVSGSYTKIHGSSPVITLSSKFGSVSSCSRMSWHTCTAALSFLFQQLWNHFCTDLSHPQIFPNDSPHPREVHVELICNHSNSQAAISMQLLADKLDIFLGPACVRPPAPGVIFYILPSLNLLCHSKAPALDIMSSPYTSCSNLSASVGVFPSRTRNFKLVCCSVVIVLQQKLRA